MEMSAARSKHDTWKDSRAAEVRPISLWRVLTLDMYMYSSRCVVVYPMVCEALRFPVRCYTYKNKE